MDRAEATGLGVSLAGHGAVLAALALGLASVSKPPLPTQPIEVSFVEDIGLVTAVTEPTTEAPAQSVAPDVGAPEEAAPLPVEAPAPPAPEPEPVPAPPEPKPAPPTPKQTRPAPAPKEKATPAPKEKAAPAAKQKAAPAPKEKTAPAKQAASKAPPTKAKAAGEGTAEKARGSRLGKDFLKGIGLDETPSRSQKATGAVMSAQAMTGIVAAIQRQIQPCADRQVNPGPGANRIQVKLNLKLNPDGSLAGRPRVVSTSGVDDENERYEKRVADLAIAAFTGCSPLRGLPAELYETARGGWSNFNMNYKLPG